MRLTNGSKRIRLTVVLSAVAIAIGGLGVAGPAQAAEPDHCVVALPEQNVRCFDTFEAAKAFVASVAEVTPPKSSGTAVQRVGAPVAAAALIPIPTLIYIGYDWANRNPLGGTLWVLGMDGGCTTPTNDLDYSLSSLSARWNNDISSNSAYSNCWADGWDLTSWGGTHTGYHGSQDFIGNGLDNDISSLLFS